MLLSGQAESASASFQLFYLGFLMFYSYVVLVKMPDWPSPQEWVVILYIFSSAVEKVREVCRLIYQFNTSPFNFIQLITSFSHCDRFSLSSLPTINPPDVHV